MYIYRANGKPIGCETDDTCWPCSDWAVVNIGKAVEIPGENLVRGRERKV